MWRWFVASFLAGWLLAGCTSAAWSQPRPKIVVLVTIEVEEENDASGVRVINLISSEGDRCSVVGPAGELIDWLVAQRSQTAVMITMVNP
jgi:hypothetical protein